VIKKPHGDFRLSVIKTSGFPVSPSAGAPNIVNEDISEVQASGKWFWQRQ
jgi:hypothetical protein